METRVDLYTTKPHRLRPQCTHIANLLRSTTNGYRNSPNRNIKTLNDSREKGIAPFGGGVRGGSRRRSRPRRSWDRRGRRPKRAIAQGRRGRGRGEAAPSVAGKRPLLPSTTTATTERCDLLNSSDGPFFYLAPSKKKIYKLP